MDKNNDRILFAQQMKLIPLILFGATVLAISRTAYSLQIVSEQVVKNIFTQNQIYMIYVTEDHDLIMQSYFNQYCNEGNLCAILDKSSHLYDDLFQYIGRKKSEFFVILDAARKVKYIMPVIENMTSIDIRIFLAKFQQGLLQPFYASQKPEINSYPPCRKVVGKNLDQFLAHQAPLKVLYLYSDYKYCQDCGEILRSFADFAQKTYDPKMIIFGYYNVLMNDHEMIKDENYPHFLIFASPNKKPINIESGQLPKLQQKIIELVTSKQKVKIKPASQPDGSSDSSDKEVEIEQQL